MKTMKKTLSLVLAIVMALALAMPALAVDDTHTISLASTDTHTYKVFQVLTGTLSGEGSKQLGNPAWGADATDAAKETDVKDFITAITAEGISQQDIAQLVAEKVDTTGNGQGTVKKDQPLSGLATGYYVLVDTTTLAEYGNDPKKIDTKALNVVLVLNNITDMEIKWGTVEDKKEISGDTLGDATTESPRTPDSASTDNVSIGDTVQFKITAKIPANADEYNYFYFVINDTLDPGLTLNADSITVYKDSVNNDNKLANTAYQVKTGQDASNADTYAGGKTFQVGLNDAKSLAGKDIIVTYSAVLNENATIGEVPNKNTSTVTYSNDPNHDYNGTPENPKPGFPASTDLDAMGETPESKTETYVTGIKIQKVDENHKALTGAEFTLTGNSMEIVLVTTDTYTKDDNGTYYKLKDGTYTTQAPSTDPVMIEAPAGSTDGYVLWTEGDPEEKVTVGDKDYRVVRDGETPAYILQNGNGDLYESTTDKYVKSQTIEQKGARQTSTKVVGTVAADGTITFTGLGAGEYTITESKTPAGYNTIAPITVNIAFTANPTEGNDHWTKDSSGATYNADTGLFELTVVNEKGTELPETGGIGTKIFYTMGAVLVIGAGVVLVSRKRAAE